MTDIRKFIVITGLSGAGKSTALKALEDQGCFAVGNIPPGLLPQLATELSHNGRAPFVDVAAVVDVRTEAMIDALSASMETLRRSAAEVLHLYLEADDDRLLQRYETTRRRHPIGEDITILESIAQERALMRPLKEVADSVVDTSALQPNELRKKILEKLHLYDEPFTVIVSSFGFKHGVPKDADYVFDVRFLPNPNYVPELKHLTGADLPVRSYLDRVPAKKVLLDRLQSLMEFVLRYYDNTGKKQAHIAVGCTGGRHRSVAVAVELSERLAENGHRTTLHHRDIDRESA